MGNPLVIVESPAKARTIARFLGDDYVVESSVGHIRDLPSKAAEIPQAYKGMKWANLGVDTENHFKPLYVVSPNKKDQVRHLKALLKDADELYLATDEDREGEAIAWHLLEVLKPKVPVRRMVFHEITKDAIVTELKNSNATVAAELEFQPHRSARGLPSRRSRSLATLLLAQQPRRFPQHGAAPPAVSAGVV